MIASRLGEILSPSREAFENWTRAIEDLREYAQGGEGVEAVSLHLQLSDEARALLRTDQGRSEVRTWAHFYRRTFRSMNVVADQAASGREYSEPEWTDAAVALQRALTLLASRLESLARK